MLEGPRPRQPREAISQDTRARQTQIEFPVPGLSLAQPHSISIRQKEPVNGRVFFLICAKMNLSFDSVLPQTFGSILIFGVLGILQPNSTDTFMCWVIEFKVH